MVFNLEPLDITLDFERKTYRLGDTINATVEFIPSRDVEIRGASLSVMAQVRRSRAGMGTTMGLTLGLQSGASTIQGGVPHRTTDYLPMQQHTDQKIVTEVFYSTSIVLTESLRKGNVSRHNVALILNPHLPRLRVLAEDAKNLKRDANTSLSIRPWWLEARADVVLGRDAIARREIQVAVSLANLAES